MRFNEPGIQRLACDIVQSFIHSGFYEDSNLEEIPQIAITALTGQSLHIDGKTSEERLTVLDDLLSVPKPNSELDIRLSNNCRIICQAMDIDSQCESLIKLGALCTINFGLNDFINTHLYYTNENLNMMVASALDIELIDLETFTMAISRSSLFRQHNADLQSVLKLPKELVRNMVSMDAFCFKQLVGGFFEVQPKSSLSLKDFPHLQLEYLTQFLKQVVKQQLSGVNILLHGPSGTGKTELSKLLAQDTKSGLMTVKAQGEEYRTKEDELTSELNAATLRLQYHGLLNAMLSNEPKSMLLIDECEDIFYEYLNGKKVSKDRLHQVLSDNPVPTIWVTNHVNQLEDSCIRRFSYVLEVPTPPSAIKTKIISKPLQGLYLSQAFKHSLSQIDDLTPAHANQAANVARLVNIKGSEAQHCIEEHIEQTLTACGLEATVENYRTETDFNPDYINIKSDGKSSIKSIKSLIKTVKNYNGVRCLLTGISGSGKSGLVHYLADEVGQKLLVIQPADVLDMYVGGSEKKIQKLFSDAFREDKMILIDECDSLLRSRSETNNQWERSVVNQLLLSLERTSTTTFLCTNFNEAHHGSLDSALLRRIDFKVQLDYLTAEQTVKIYEETFGKCSAEIKNQLGKFKQVTPGDIAVLSRRNRFSKLPLSDSENLEILIAEMKHKKTNKAIGFIN
tara:strand:+ start:11856 stop:13898 length:2043 start_codon:yes stop_codon:yes gene_type:complete